MLTLLKLKGWDVLADNSDGNAAELFDAVLAARKSGEGMISAKITGKVQKIEIGGKTYILKNISGHKHRTAYYFQNAVRGSYTFRLARAVHRAVEKNREARRCPEIYLAANRMKFGVPVESCLLMEFIDGKDVTAIPDGIARYGNACAETVAWLHENGIVHSDACADNFIVEKRTGKVFAIDVSGKVPTGIQKAKDRARIEQVFGVRNRLRDFGWFWTAFSSRRRSFFHALKNRLKP